ncbi:MAG: hypothetical protein OEZ34_10240, partial [Spirochaetia bacterium]|nr:hypothetical protein [Spirochaetia bacterium]
MVFLIILYAAVPPKYSFANDSLIKLLQAKSFTMNHYESENYYYHWKGFDTEYKFFPIEYSLYVLKTGDIISGPFSVFFSYFTSFLFLFLPYEALPLFSGFIFLLILLLLRRFPEGNYFAMLTAAFTTGLAIFAAEYSENILFLFMIFVSQTLLFTGKKDSVNYIIAGLILGISVVFRLESILYFPMLIISFFLFKRDKEFFRKVSLFSFSFFFAVSLFFIFNHLNYGHPLGTKFLVDESNFFRGFYEKLLIYISLYFGQFELVLFKPGFFGLTPLFAVLLIYSFVKWKKINENLKILLVSIYLYFLIAPMFSPHDGQWSWGARYLTVGIFAFSLLAGHFYESEKSKKTVLLVSILSIYSFFQLALGLSLISMSAGVMKEVQIHTEDIQSDLRIFHNGVLSLHTGPQILDEPTVLLNTTEDQDRFFGILKKHYSGKTVSV